MTHEQLIAAGYMLYTDGTYSKLPPGKSVKADREVSHSEPQRDVPQALVAEKPREVPRLRRTLVRFVGHRNQLLDPDSFAGSCKDLLDGLCHAGLLPGDSPADIVLEVSQVRVAHRKDEVTVIEIEPL